jgi:hypothetical protein
MPLFHFHLTSTDAIIQDDEGTELRDVEHAIEHGEAVAHELSRNRAPAECSGNELVIVDAAGNEVRRIPLDSASLAIVPISLHK